MIYLDGVGTPADGSEPTPVWVTGKIIAKLHEWCRTLYRRMSREVLTSFQEEEYGDASEHPDMYAPDNHKPFDWLDCIDFMDWHCTSEERDMLLMQVQGYTCQEIADHLGLSLTNCTTKMLRLRVRIKQEYKDEQRRHELAGVPLVLDLHGGANSPL